MPHNWEEAELTVGRVKSAWQGFKDFALRDNVLEVATGLVIATAFTSVVNSLTTNVLLPPLSLLPFMNRNLQEKFVILRRGLNYNETIGGYNTLQQATDDGAVTLAWGLFLSNLSHFFAVALALYIFAQAYSKLSKDSIITKTTKCIFCRKSISEKARRCAFCTSWQDGREDSSTQ